jgi:hypothetical protein
MTGLTAGTITKWWTGPSTFFGQTFNTAFSGEEFARGAPMPQACNLTTIVLYASTAKKGTASGDNNPDLVTLTIMKNNLATTMTCSASSTGTVHQPGATSTCTLNPVSFNAGDTLGLEWIHSNLSSTLFTQVAAGLRCE